MNHLTKAVLWLLLALLVVSCCTIDVINQNWFALVIGVIAFVLNIINASIEFSTWAREQGKKEARKTERDNNNCH